MARASREIWLKRIERFHDSGLTAAEFATEIGVNVNTLKNWIWRVSSGANQGAATHRVQRAETKESAERTPRRASQMVEVVGALPPRPSPSYELALPSGVSLRLPTDFEVERVRLLVALASEVR